MAIIPSDPITNDFNYDKLFQSMNLVTLQRLLDAIRAQGGTSGLATEVTLAAIKAKTDQMVFTADKLRTTGEDGSGGGSISPVYAGRVQMKVDDTGIIEIPANASRKSLRISNEDGEECYFTFGDFAPVFKQDIQLKKKVSVIFPINEVGTGKLRFITKVGKTTIVTYQDGT